MAAIFLLLAVIVGVILGDVVLGNTDSASADLFNRTVTGFTHGQILIMAAGLGFLFALFLFMAWGSSSSRRAKRRERRLIRRDLESRVVSLERENASLREELNQVRPTDRSEEPGREPEPDTQEREPALAMRQRERAPGDSGDGDGSIRDRLERGERVEEPARPERA